MTDDGRVIVEYNGTLVALAAPDAERFMADGTIAPCSTCEPPCGYLHVAPDRVADRVMDAGRPVSSRPGSGRAALAPDRPLPMLNSSHVEHP